MAAATVVKKPLAAAPISTSASSRRERRRPRCRCCQPAVSACRRFWDELLDAVRRRRSSQQQREQQDTSEDTDEDLGLPRSPCNSPPTTADVLLDKPLKENPTKSHSTCSDGSLLSMGSSEMDEDSIGQNSGHSSKLSLHDKKVYQENDAELDIGVSATPLSHSAARHKMAVRPKRTHGAPRRHRMQQLSTGSSLPTTPEVNEEISGRSISPEVKQKKALTPGEHVNKLPRSRSNAAYRQTEASPTHRYKRAASASELEMNMSSIIALEALTKSREMFGVVGEEDEDEKCDHSESKEKDENKEKDEKKEETTFFGRLLSRRSGKKKKEKLDDVDNNFNVDVDKQFIAPPQIPKRINEGGQYSNDFFAEKSFQQSSKYQSTKIQSRSSAASRQRVEPINLPPSPELEKKANISDIPLAASLPPDSYKEDSTRTNKNSDISDKENVLPDRIQITTSTSPPKPRWLAHTTGTNEEFSSNQFHNIITDKIVETHRKSRDEPHDESEFKSSFRIGEVISHEHQSVDITGDLEERECSSLVDTVEKPLSPKFPVKKSQSFRTDIEFLHKPHKVSTPITRSTLPDVTTASEDHSFQEDLEVEETTISYKSTISATILGDETNIMKMSTEGQMSKNSAEQELLLYESDRVTDNRSLFTNNVYVSTRSVLKEKTIENILTDIPPSEISPVKENDLITQRIISSDNGNSDENTKNSHFLSETQSKQLSTTDVTNYMQQVVLPSNIDGVTVTQTVTLQEDAKIQLQESIKNSEQEYPVDIYNGDHERTDVSAHSYSQSMINEIIQQQAEQVNVHEEPKLGMTVSEAVTIEDNDQNDMKKAFVETRAVSGRSQQEKDILVSTSTSRSPFIKREARPATAAEEHIPEFLRIQLNRVDSQPAVNVIFDTDKPEQHRARLRSIDEKLGENVEHTSDPNDFAKRSCTGSESAQLATSSIKQRLIREEQLKIPKDGKNIDTSSESTHKVFEPVSTFDETIRANNDTEMNNPMKTRRSISLVTAPSQQTKNYSVVSVSSDQHSTKFPLKKQSSSFDSPDTLVPSTEKNNVCESDQSKKISKSEISMPEKDSFSQEVVIRKKSVSRKEDESVPCADRISSGRESVSSEASSTDNSHRSSKSKDNFSGPEVSSFDTGTNDVVLRKKSVTKEVNVKNEEEPELLKVFARRSLKLKDSDIEILGQQNTPSKNRESQSLSDNQTTKSRDSDKENECGDSPKEERKKQPAKEPLAESKLHIDVVPESSFKLTTIGASINNTRHSSPANFKYQRSLSGSSSASNDTVIVNENILSPHKKDNMSPEKRTRNRSVPETPRTDSCHISSEKSSHRAWANVYREKDVHLTRTESKATVERLNSQTDNETNASELEETAIPRFKRIQQRREEWEKRAQLASKRTLP